MGRLGRSEEIAEAILLAAHDQGLSTLWFSLFEKSDVCDIFAISGDKDPVAVTCVGYPQRAAGAPPARASTKK